MQNLLHENMKLRSELQHASDVLIDEHENIGMPSQPGVKSIVTYVEVGKSNLFLKYTC
jgi:hypothetical protein